MLFLHASLVPQQDAAPHVKINGIYSSESKANKACAGSKDIVIETRVDQALDLEALAAEIYTNAKDAKRAEEAEIAEAKRAEELAAELAADIAEAEAEIAEDADFERDEEVEADEEAEEVELDDEAGGYETWTKKRLQEYADFACVKYTSRDTKADLVKLITEAGV